MRSLYCAIALALTLSSMVLEVEGTPPSAPFSMRLELSGPPFLNEQVQLTFEISAKVDSYGIEALVEVPSSFKLDRPISWKGDLLKGQTKTFTTTLEPLQEGYWLLRGTTIPYEGVLSRLYLSTYRGEEYASSYWWEDTPGIDFFGDLTVEGVPRPNSTVKVTYTVTSSDPMLLRSRNTTINMSRQAGGTFSFPTGAVLVSGSTSWAGRLLPGETAVVSFTMKFVANTVYLDMDARTNFEFIGARVIESYPTNPYKVSVTFYVYEGRWVISRDAVGQAMTSPLGSISDFLLFQLLLVGMLTVVVLIGWYRGSASLEAFSG